MKYKNLTIIGTSHISNQSLKDVENAVNEIKPEIICLELDRNRFYALTHNVKGKTSLKDILRIGFKGYLFSLIGAYVEKKMGQKVGVVPGSEMLKSIELANQKRIRIALIDQDIEKTLKRFSQEFSWKERFKAMWDLIKALVIRKNEINFDLRKVPKKEVIDELIRKVKERYPGLYKVLIEERNEFMASKLTRIINLNEGKNVLAVVGAGHEEEIINIIKNKRIDIINR